MGNNKKKSKDSSNGRSPHNGSRSTTAHVATSAPGRRIEQSSTANTGHLRTYSIPDYRLERPNFTVQQSIERDKDGAEHLRYEVTGDFDAPAPPIRDSKYLTKEQAIEIYRYMLLNRKMEIALENLYKQGKVVGGVYFGLGQEACSCASSYALDEDDWFAPMIRNQGALLVRGFGARDIMMQYMAKAGSPTKGRDGTSHFGDIEKRNMVSPISMLGDLIPVMAGVALGARLQGRNLAVLTYIGDGGQSTGVTYEGINFAAVRISASCSSLNRTTGPTRRPPTCSTAARTLPNAPSDTASPASSSTAPTPVRFTTPPMRLSNAPIAAKAPRSSKPK